MAKLVEVNPAELGCINLHGINMDKLRNVLRWFDMDAANHGFGLIDLRENPRSEGNLLILDGVHRSVVTHLRRVLIQGMLWESSDEPDSPLARVNFDRSPGLWITTSVLGKGSVQEIARGIRI